MPSSTLIPDSSKYDLAIQLRACQSNSRRNGKVARLPLDLRQQINQMIDDGLPYKVIIEKLGPAGQHLNEDNISNWRLGGYQDYLKAQTLTDLARFQTEAAADVVREMNKKDSVKLPEICRNIALVQYIDTLIEHGEEIARQSLEKNPAKFITLINAAANSSNATIALQKQKWHAEDRLTGGTSSASPNNPNPPEPQKFNFFRPNIRSTRSTNGKRNAPTLHELTDSLIR